MDCLLIDNEKPQSIFIRLWNGILCFFLLSGLYLNMWDLSDNMIAHITIGLCSLIVPLTLCLLSESKIQKNLFYSIPIFSAGIIFIIWHKYIFKGFAYIYNLHMDMIGQAKGIIIKKLATEGQASDFDVIIFMLFSMIILTLPIALSVKFNKVSVPFVLAVMVTAFGVYVEHISYIGFVFLLISVVSLVLKKYLKYGDFNDRKLFVLRVTSLFLVLAITLSLINAVGENKVDFLDSCNKSVIKSVDKIRYGENILPDGDFENLSDFKPTKNSRLEVVMSKPESYYLRGYVGEKYNSNGWENIDNSRIYESSDLFYWLHKKGFYGQTQMSDIAGIVASDVDKNRITIKNISASKKYIYAPYEILYDNNKHINSDEIGDGNITAKGIFPEESYTYYSLNNQVRSYTSIGEKLYDSEKNADNKLDEYLRYEAHYNQFIYENYLEIPDDVKAVLTSLLGEYKEENTHCDYGEAKQKILAYLTTNFEYSESPEKCSGDFVTSFLQETKEGYSVHFATAATLMFRYLGIPARYVEGYIVKPDDIEGKLSSSAIILNDTNAHAWVEFYQDGVGWIPFETTPKYLDIMEKADDLKGIETESNSNKNNMDKPEKDNAQAKEGIDEYALQKEEKSNWVSIVLIILTLILLGVVVALVVKNLLKRKNLKQIYQTFSSDDIKLSINNLFIYSNHLLENFSLQKDSFGKDYEEIYEKSLDIFNEAVYSNHSMSEEKRDVLLDFEKLTVKKIKQCRSKSQIFKDEYIKHLYF